MQSGTYEQCGRSRTSERTLRQCGHFCRESEERPEKSSCSQKRQPLVCAKIASRWTRHGGSSHSVKNLSFMESPAGGHSFRIWNAIGVSRRIESNISVRNRQSAR